MSDWELATSSGEMSSEPAVSSEWEVATSPAERPSFGKALMQAPGKIAKDVYGSAMQFARNVPGYYEAAKTEIPGVYQTLKNNPAITDPFLNKNSFAENVMNLADNLTNLHRANSQMMAGFGEAGMNALNFPANAVNYLSSGRLNLIPENVNQFVQEHFRLPENTQQRINEYYGMPERPGEALFRGIPRNVFAITGGGMAASALNPLNLTASSIARKVILKEAQEIASHTKRYNQIWKEADKTGFNNVPVDIARLQNNLSVISKYKTPREFASLDEMIKNPTLQNAQKAQSDLNQIHRKLEEKSRSGSLTSEERAIYDAAHDAEKHIESNMFRNASGNTNKKLQNKYKKLTTSYRENVVPYRYNRAIQEYKARERTAPELVNALSHGEFAAKKGSSHPAIGMRKNIMPLMTGAGLVGGGATLYDLLLGNRRNNENQQGGY